MDYSFTKVKKRQIQMAVLTGITLIIGIVSAIDRYWISTIIGRICQFFYWGFFKIFNGIDHAYTSQEVFESVVKDKYLQYINPLLTLELVIFLCIIIVIALPISMLIERAAVRLFTHFTALHGFLFGLSIVEWIALPVLNMQYFPDSPIILGMNATAVTITLHIWFYLTLLTYLSIKFIYDVTGRYEIYENVHTRFQLIWNACFRMWKSVAKACIVVASLGVILLFMVIARTTRVSYHDYDVFY